MMMMSQQPQQQQQQQQQPSNFRQQPNRPSNFDDVMMPQRGPEASGGYNFQRVMDDHFEHYKRPPSRERSVDLTNLPTSLVEACQIIQTSIQVVFLKTVHEAELIPFTFDQNY